MSILKQKILRAQQAAGHQQAAQPRNSPPQKQSPKHSPIQKRSPINKGKILKDLRKDQASPKPEGENLTPVQFLFSKNIVRNYSKAICRFILSPVSDEYMCDIIKKDNLQVNAKTFKDYIKLQRKSLDCIPALKKLLIVEEYDDIEMAHTKKLFVEMALIFIKYFSVKWIFNSRLSYKFAYLKFRFSFERRLKNPELFNHMNPFGYLKKLEKKKSGVKGSLN
eukprot:CAMPEP_0114592912 /NCGR_PEP_ID=MMETSP0125-20121206/14616_1 /TAXON_ID=485358 ORGANISM="Aristerostoma sp., Strain ATCC 50986" /NCGR_SAMPLE_ID=MMETSP0125 /ASSEMBLY_ACC=CAM_ASM_000245 /LENGTH=221 /DNA_ID=CAMNT_0001791785 /DNA_START=32 /DNA_END=697 /DNA_ORIENTATION=+